jgi:AraC-like DNA-binding protein
MAAEAAMIDIPAPPENLYRLYNIINGGMATFTATIALIFATLAVPKSAALRGYRLSLKFMTAVYVAGAFGPIAEYLLRDLAMATRSLLNVYLRMIAISYLLVFIKPALICIVNTHYLKWKSFALELCMTTIISFAALFTFLYAPSPKAWLDIAFQAFRVYYGLQIVYGSVAFFGFLKRIQERMDDYYAGQKDAYLSWVKQISVLYLSVFIMCFFSLLAPAPMLIADICSIYGALVFFACGIRYLNFVFLFYRLAPVFDFESIEAASRSTLVGIDVDPLLHKLAALMDKERLYADEGLNIAQLSGRLEISRNQLSELINGRIGMNFRNYINSIRVEAAKLRLSADPGESIMDIALSCGFSSKSTFYSAFVKLTGTTPRDWRKKNGKSRFGTG